MNQCLIVGSSNLTAVPSSASGSTGHHTSLSYTQTPTQSWVFALTPDFAQNLQVLWVSSRIPSLMAMTAIGWGHFVSKYSCCEPYPVWNPVQLTHAHGLGLTGDTAATGHDPTGW